jgi:hypothetical protein
LVDDIDLMEVHMSDSLDRTEEARASSARDVTHGAQFWVHISPQQNTEQWVEQWEVRFELGDWSGTISSDNPQEILQTPGLAGIFSVTVTGSGPNMPRKLLVPLPESMGQIRCGGNCAAMVGIIANADGADARFWTVWDALCN